MTVLLPARYQGPHLQISAYFQIQILCPRAEHVNYKDP